MTSSPRETPTRPFPGMWLAIVFLLVLGVTIATIVAVPSLLVVR